MLNSLLRTDALTLRPRYTSSDFNIHSPFIFPSTDKHVYTEVEQKITRQYIPMAPCTKSNVLPRALEPFWERNTIRPSPSSVQHYTFPLPGFTTRLFLCGKQFSGQ